MSAEVTSIPVNRQPETTTLRDRQRSTASAVRTQVFNRLMRTHEKQVLGTAWRLLGRLEDAQDAAQEVFLRLYRYLDGFDSERPVSPWLYRITVNVCHDLNRHHRRRAALSLEELEESYTLPSTDPSTDPGTMATVTEEGRIVEQALATLAKKERAAIVLRDIQGLSTSEVATALGSSEATVRSQICRARLKIKSFRDRKLGRTPQ